MKYSLLKKLIKMGFKENLKTADFEGANFGNANFRNVDFEGADFGMASFRNADFTDADFTDADFWNGDFRGANFGNANFRNANFSDAGFEGANFSDAGFEGANFEGANFRRADFEGANFRTKNKFKFVKKNFALLHSIRIVRNNTEIIGWKKCENNVIVKLRIPKNARRSNATGRKCRAEFAEVLAIYGADEAVSIHDENLKYRVGGIVRVDNFDPNRFNECATGVHFFLTLPEAKEY